MTLLGTRIFANVIKLRRVLIRTAVGPNPKDRWPYKEGEDRHPEKDISRHCPPVTQAQTKKC